VIDGGIDNAPATRKAEGVPQGTDRPELELRPEMRADPIAAAEPVEDLPRDIAREPPRDGARDAPRPPIRDIARDPAAATKTRDAYREAPRDKPRDATRDPLHELLREVTASREPPRQPPPASQPVAPAAAPARTATVRNPGPPILGILVLILGLIGAALLAWQLRLLQGQMTDLHAAIAQNGKIADAAGRLSDAATQANEIANQALVGSTRPWVGVDAVEAGSIQASQTLNIEVRVRNSGRTPSTDVQGLFLVYISPINNPPALLADQCANCVRSVVLPNGVVSYKLSVRDSVMSVDEVQRIKDGKDTMWIVGRLDYHDGEGEAHTTRSCLYYRATGIASFTACGDGNSAN
jgi:xanthosine utilization system XapX-like protein